MNKFHSSNSFKTLTTSKQETDEEMRIRSTQEESIAAQNFVNIEFQPLQPLSTERILHNDDESSISDIDFTLAVKCIDRIKRDNSVEQTPLSKAINKNNKKLNQGAVKHKDMQLNTNTYLFEKTSG